MRKEQFYLQFQIPAALAHFFLSVCLSVCIFTHSCVCGFGAPARCAGACGTKPAHSGAVHWTTETQEAMTARELTALTKYPLWYLEYQRIWIKIAGLVLVGLSSITILLFFLIYFCIYSFGRAFLWEARNLGVLRIKVRFPAYKLCAWTTNFPSQKIQFCTSLYPWLFLLSSCFGLVCTMSKDASEKCHRWKVFVKRHYFKFLLLFVCVCLFS